MPGCRNGSTEGNEWNGRLSIRQTRPTAACKGGWPLAQNSKIHDTLFIEQQPFTVDAMPMDPLLNGCSGVIHGPNFPGRKRQKTVAWKAEKGRPCHVSTDASPHPACSWRLYTKPRTACTSGRPDDIKRSFKKGAFNWQSLGRLRIHGLVVKDNTHLVIGLSVCILATFALLDSHALSCRSCASARL